MAASIFFAPVVYPWYLLWLLPPVRSVATLPIIIWTNSIIPTYHVWQLRTLGQSVGASWLDCAAGVRMRGRSCSDCFAGDCTIGAPQSSADGVGCSQPHLSRFVDPGWFERHPTRHPFDFTEENLP